MQTSLRSPLALTVSALGLGIIADQLLLGRWPGIAIPLFVFAGLSTLGALSRAEGQAPSRSAWWLGAGALLFAALLAVRDTPTLVLLNLAACASLLLLLVASFRGASLFHLPLFAAFTRLLLASAHIVATPILLGARVRTIPLGRIRRGAALPLVRGLALALPLVLCFGGLLAAADAVFASYVGQLLQWNVPLDFNQLFLHGIALGGVGWLCAGGLATALTLAPATISTHLPAEGDTQRLHAQAWRPLGLVEALTVLIALDGLFSAFIAVQAAYLFGGLNTLERTGATFADYARRGFFELVFVACLALGVLLLLAVLTRRTPTQRRRFNAASIGMVVLVLGMLVSAFQRMWLYEQAYGFTELRLYTHSVMIWLAVVLLLFVLGLLRNTLQLFVRGVVVASLVYALALNLANPLDLIVRANIANHAAGAPLDVDYLGTLSADATPALVAALGQLDSASRQELQGYLIDQRLALAEAADAHGWPAWNRARAQALQQTAGLTH